MTDITENSPPTTRGVNRRQLIKAGAWAAPAVVLATAAPRAAAATGGSGVTLGAATLARVGGNVNANSRNLRINFDVLNSPGQDAAVNVAVTIQTFVNGAWANISWNQGPVITPAASGASVPANNSTPFIVLGSVKPNTTTPLRANVSVTVTSPYSATISTVSNELTIP